MICVFSDRQWSDLLGVIGKRDVRGDPRFGGSRMRARHRDVIDGLLSQWTTTHTVDEVVSAMGAADVPARPSTRRHK